MIIITIGDNHPVRLMVGQGRKTSYGVIVKGYLANSAMLKSHIRPLASQQRPDGICGVPLHNVVLRKQTFEEPDVPCIKLQRIQIRLLELVATLRESLCKGLY